MTSNSVGVTIATAGLVVLMACPGRVLAQRRPGGLLALPPSAPTLGLRSGYEFSASAWSVGGRSSVPLSPRVELLPSVDAFFLGARTAWQANLDAALLLGPRGDLYAGGGIAFGNRDTDPLQTNAGRTRAHLNLLAGLRFPGRVVKPYVEGRWTFLEQRTPLHLVFGLDIPIHSGG